MFKKDLTKSVTDELQKEDPWGKMIELLTTKDVKTKKPVVELLPNASIIVRLKDNWYDALYEKPLDTSRMKYYFLPENKKEKYILNAQILDKLTKTKPMKALLPKGAIEDEYNELLRRSMGLAYNVTFEDNDEKEEKPKNSGQEQEEELEAAD